jgi:hypothetical protein
MNTESTPDAQGNPYGGAFRVKETVLRNEKKARRNLDLASSRVWKVVNPSVRNRLGQPVGYALVPGENSGPYAAQDSPVRKRAGFLDAQLWVTPYHPEEMYAAGDYVNQSQGGDGLPRWTAADRPIENQDIVLWYTLGITHIPRPEDWPVMPVHHAGFKLVPYGFFSHNPSLKDGIAKPISTVKFEKDGDVPCLESALETGDPVVGPSTYILNLPSKTSHVPSKPCIVPWHYHTAEEQLTVIQGSVLAEMRGMSPTVLAPGGFATMPAKEEHQFSCNSDTCIMMVTFDGPYDIFWVKR